MADASGQRPFGYMPTLSLLVSPGLRIGLPTFAVLFMFSPDLIDPWLSIVVIALVVVLFGAWLLRFLVRRSADRRRPRGSPLHQLQEWEFSPGRVDPLMAPSSDTYALWSGSLADRLMQSWGERFSKVGDMAFSVAFHSSLVVWTLFYGMMSLSVLDSFKSRTETLLGLPLWVLFLISAVVVTILDTARWARDTRRDLRRRRAIA